jgi:hypothetical protein
LLLGGEEKTAHMKFSKVDHVLAKVDMHLALSIASAAVGKAPLPHITFPMVRLAQHLARIVRLGGSELTLAPLYAAAIVQDRGAFVTLFHGVLARAEAVITADD